jgi:Flp pilus assembly protein protease CpaA
MDFFTILILLFPTIIMSIQDIYYREASNYLIILTFIIGLFIVKDLTFIPLVIMMFTIGIILYTFKVFGAADSKLLAIYPMILPYSGFPNGFVVCMLFLIVLCLLTGLYALVWNMFKHKKNKWRKIPLIPIFFLAYIITYLLGFH